MNIVASVIGAVCVATVLLTLHLLWKNRDPWGRVLWLGYSTRQIPCPECAGSGLNPDGLTCAICERGVTWEAMPITRPDRTTFMHRVRSRQWWNWPRPR